MPQRGVRGDTGGNISMSVTLSTGQTYKVSSGQTDTGDIVLGGGTLNVLSGGTISNTTNSGGIFVSAGGTSISASINNNGTQRVVGGRTFATTVVNGQQFVSSGGIAIGATIFSAG